jgi:hypothetical protein
MSLKSPGTLLKESYSLYREHFALLVSIAIVPALVSVVALLLGESAPMVLSSEGSTPLGITLGLASFLLSVCTTIALTLTIAHRAEISTFSRAYQYALPFYVPYLIVTIISGLAVVLGLFAFVIPGVIIGVWLCFTQFTTILEGKKGLEALVASKELVRGLWFDVFMRLLILCFVFLLVLIAITIIIDTVVTDDMFFGVVTDFISSALTPIAVIYVYTMYKDVQHLKKHVPQAPTPVV